MDMSEVLSQTNSNSQMPLLSANTANAANSINTDDFQDGVAETQDNNLLDRPRPRLDRIRIIPNTRAINRDLILQVKKSFTYIPDDSTVFNAMMIAGDFEIEEVKQHICQAFSRPARTTLDESRILRIKLLPEAFSVCKHYRLQLGRELFFAPDIHTVTNALLCTGDFKPQSVVSVVCSLFQDPNALRVNYNETSMS